MTYEGLLNAGIFLTTKASSQNAYREWTYTYTNASTPTKCRMVPVRVEERIAAPGLYDDVVYTCYTLSSATLATGDQVSYRDKNYRIKQCELDSSWHHRKSLLIEVP